MRLASLALATVFTFAIWLPPLVSAQAMESRQVGSWLMQAEVPAQTRAALQKAMQVRLGPEALSGYEVVSAGCHDPPCNSVGYWQAFAERPVARHTVTLREFMWMRCSGERDGKWRCDEPWRIFRVGQPQEARDLGFDVRIDGEAARTVTEFVVSGCLQKQLASLRSATASAYRIRALGWPAFVRAQGSSFVVTAALSSFRQTVVIEKKEPESDGCTFRVISAAETMVVI